MCFNQPMTGGMALLGLGLTIFVHFRMKNNFLTVGCFYLSLMEILQFFQYFWVDRCDLWINRFLTVLGWVHISWQPYFTHYVFSAGMKLKEHKVAAKMSRRLAFLAGLFLFMRVVFPYFGIGIYDNTEGFNMGYDEEGRQIGWNSTCGLCAEWIRGRVLCTYTGRTHLAWSIPLTTPSYFMPGLGLHMFMLYGPYFVMWGRNHHLVVFGILSYLTGPVLSRFITDDLHEQGAIWCFFSAGQTVVMVLYALMFDKDGGWVKNKKKKNKNI